MEQQNSLARIALELDYRSLYQLLSVERGVVLPDTLPLPDAVDTLTDVELAMFVKHLRSLSRTPTGG